MLQSIVRAACVLVLAGGAAVMAGARRENRLPQSDGHLQTVRHYVEESPVEAYRWASEESYEALGRVKVLDFNRASAWSIPAAPGDTLSGLVFNLLGHPPHAREEVQLPGYRLRVLEVSGTRITRLRVSRRAEDPP